MNILNRCKAILMARGFTADQIGTMSPVAIFGLAIAALFIAAVIPVALTALNDTNTTGWSAGEIALFGFLGLAILGTVVLALLPKGGGKGT